MRRIYLALVALTRVMPAVVNAADMYTKAPTVERFSWNGFYLGATAGAAWDGSEVNLNAVNGVPPYIPPANLASFNALGSASFGDAKGVFGGKLGYNWQLPSAWVFGIEADLFSGSDRTSNSSGNPYAGYAPGSSIFVTQVSTDWMATVRPRLGYAFDRTLVYATGGVAFGKVSFTNTLVDFSPNGLGLGNEASSASQVKTGWAVGAGADFALARSWIVSVEYLHVDLGTVSTSGQIVTGGAPTATLNFATKVQSDIARVGISYKF